MHASTAAPALHVPPIKRSKSAPALLEQRSKKAAEAIESQAAATHAPFTAAPDGRTLKRRAAVRRLRAPAAPGQAAIPPLHPKAFALPKASELPNPYAVGGHSHHHPGATAGVMRVTFGAWSLLALGRSLMGVLQAPFAAATSLACLLCALHDAYDTQKSARDAGKDYAQLYAMHLGALNVLAQARMACQSTQDPNEQAQANALIAMATTTLKIIDELLGKFERRYVSEAETQSRANERSDQRKKADAGTVQKEIARPALVAATGLEPGWSPFKGMAAGQIAYFRDVTLTAITTPVGLAAVTLGLTGAVIGSTADMAGASLGLNAFLFPFGIVGAHANLHAARKIIHAADKAKTERLAKLGGVQELKNQLEDLYAKGQLSEEDYRIARDVADGFRHQLLVSMNINKRGRHLGLIRAAHAAWGKYVSSTAGAVALAAFTAALVTAAAAATAGVAAIVAAAIGGVTIVPALGSLAYGTHKRKQEKDAAKAEQRAAEEAINHWGPQGVGKFIGATDTVRIAMAAERLGVATNAQAAWELAAKLRDNEYLRIEYLAHELHELSRTPRDDMQDRSLATVLLRKRGMPQQQIDYLLQSREVLGGQHRRVCRQLVAEVYEKELYASDELPGKGLHDVADTQEVMERFVLDCTSPELLELLEKTPEEWEAYHRTRSPEQRSALRKALTEAQQQLLQVGAGARELQNLQDALLSPPGSPDRRGLHRNPRYPKPLSNGQARLPARGDNMVLLLELLGDPVRWLPDAPLDAPPDAAKPGLNMLAQAAPVDTNKSASWLHQAIKSTGEETLHKSLGHRFLKRRMIPLRNPLGTPNRVLKKLDALVDNPKATATLMDRLLAQGLKQREQAPDSAPFDSADNDAYLTRMLTKAIEQCRNLAHDAEGDEKLSKHRKHARRFAEMAQVAQRLLGHHEKQVASRAGANLAASPTTSSPQQAHAPNETAEPVQVSFAEESLVESSWDDGPAPDDTASQSVRVQ